MLENSPHQVQNHKYSKFLILIWNRGASFGTILFRIDFIDNVRCDLLIKDVMKVNRVIGIGTTLQKFIDIKGNDVFLCVFHII